MNAEDQKYADDDHNNLFDQFDQRIGEKALIAPKTAADDRIYRSERQAEYHNVKEIGAARVGKDMRKRGAEDEQQQRNGHAEQKGDQHGGGRCGVFAVFIAARAVLGNHARKGDGQSAGSCRNKYGEYG